MENGKPFVKSPAFQIYPADFLADANTLVMSAAEVGAYWLLICVCWRENGLPDDVEELAGLARTPLKSFQVSWEKRIKRCFLQREDGKWTHNRLQKERDKQAANREKRQEAGSKGAKGRWQKDGNAKAKPSRRHANADGKPMAKDGLSDCSLQSSSFVSSSASSSEVERPAKKQQDERMGHPALVAVREVKGRFPSKDVWDLIIEKVGAHPDVPKMRDCWVAWRSRNYAPENLGWLVDWYVSGIPQNGRTSAGANRADRNMQAVGNVIAKYENESDETRTH